MNKSVKDFLKVFLKVFIGVLVLLLMGFSLTFLLIEAVEVIVDFSVGTFFLVLLWLTVFAATVTGLIFYVKNEVKKQ